MYGLAISETHLPQDQHLQLPLRLTPSLLPHQADHELIPIRKGEVTKSQKKKGENGE